MANTIDFQTNKVCSECPTRRAAGGTKGTKGFHINNYQHSTGYF